MVEMKWNSSYAFEATVRMCQGQGSHIIVEMCSFAIAYLVNSSGDLLKSEDMFDRTDLRKRDNIKCIPTIERLGKEYRGNQVF